MELTTHVVTQDLHFRSGREEQALDSIVGLFGTTRRLMEENRGARTFLDLAAAMLECIRPCTRALARHARCVGRVSDAGVFVASSASELHELKNAAGALRSADGCAQRLRGEAWR